MTFRQSIMRLAQSNFLSTRFNQEVSHLLSIKTGGSTPLSDSIE
ncbi:hypothetical protein Vp2S01_1068 [Vibrio parahaemolyticus]|nr:hypothetical protein Vp2S01_1068 [Vibrio parahaemolyticus]